MRTITAVIPARGGSKSIPRKNIVDINGYPLIAYSIATCKLSDRIDRVIVSTEDEEIASIARFYGAEVPFVRPVEFAKDESTDVDFLLHFFENIDVDCAALIRPTSPFRDIDFINSVVDKFYDIKDSITGLRTVHEINENPYKVYKVENDICKGFFSDYKGIKEYSNLPRQTFPKAYTGNGHIDIVKKETVKLGSTFGNKIYPVICKKIVDIDTQDDLELARLKSGFENNITNFLLEKKHSHITNFLLERKK
tara:strand:- start:692 stop:1447 length:756 start_codon:yes stop_codon:yes gene_type:complete